MPRESLQVRRCVWDTLTDLDTGGHSIPPLIPSLYRVVCTVLGQGERKREIKDEVSGSRSLKRSLGCPSETTTLNPFPQTLTLVVCGDCRAPKTLGGGQRGQGERPECVHPGKQA